MSRRRLPFVATRIVWACSALSLTERAIWAQHYALDNDLDGCAYGAGRLGRRLALSRETVERTRRRLVELELLRKRDRGLGREAAWYCAMPKVCRPKYQKMTDEEVEVWAETLNSHIGLLDGMRPEGANAAQSGVTVMPPLRAIK